MKSNNSNPAATAKPQKDSLFCRVAESEFFVVFTNGRVGMHLYQSLKTEGLSIATPEEFDRFIEQYRWFERILSFSGHAFERKNVGFALGSSYILLKKQE